MKIIEIILIIGTIIFGVLGYIETIFSLQWGKKAAWICLISFLVLSVIQIIIEKFKEAKQAEEFYNQEIVEAFPHEGSEKKLEFFTDEHGNQCVAITLAQKPIPKSLKLWEGGYDAPPITLAFDKQNEKRILFRNSAYSSYEDYRQKKGPMYQIRYFSKK